MKATVKMGKDKSGHPPILYPVKILRAMMIISNGRPE